MALDVGISSAPSNLNPFFSTDANSQNAGRLLHLSLLDVDSQMNIVCNACIKYSEKKSKGKHRVRFLLKRNLRFMDGEKVVGKHVRDAWRYYTDKKKIKSIFRFAFSSIEDVRVYNNYDVELVFKQFDLENLSNLVLFKIVKMDGERIIGAGTHFLENQTPLGFTLTPRNKNKHSVLNFKVVKDETTLALKLIRGEIDLALARISPRKYQWLKTKGYDKLNFWDIPSSNYIYININHKAPPFNDKKVRKALSLLIPRRDILKYKLHDTATLAQGLFSPAFEYFYSPTLKIDQYNPKEAQKLLNEAGFILDESGLFTKNGQPLQIDWKVSNNRASLEIVETIKSYYEKAGIKVRITVLEWGSFMHSFKSGRYDFILAQWVGFTGPEMLKNVFHSKSFPPHGANRGKYKNRFVDRKIDLATREINLGKRNRLYKAAYLAIIDDYAYINLWHPNIVWIGKKCIKDIKLYSNGSFNALLHLKDECPKKL